MTENIDDKLTFVNEAFRLCSMKLKEKKKLQVKTNGKIHIAYWGKIN